MTEDPTEHARALLARNAYLTLGTVDTDGAPWTSPVFFAADGLTDFLWVSSTGAEHSRNLAERPSVSLVVFDSTVPPYHGRALYAVGTAAEVGADELADALRVYPGPAERGATAPSASDLVGSSEWRLYRARATRVWVLCPREPRQPCRLHGRDDDHRVTVTSDVDVRT